MGINVESLDHVTVQITDVERAKKYYGGLLGLQEMPRPESFDFPGAWFRAGSSLIHLVGQPQPDPETRAHFCLWVTDIKDACKTLEAAGYKTEWNKRKIPGLERFFTRDPDGNRIEFQGPDGSVWAA